MNINSRSGSAYFDEPYSNLDWELYSNKGRSNSFNTPRTMTPLFPSQSSLPDSGLTEENWAFLHQENHYQTDNRLISSNLQNHPRYYNDSSFYSDSHFTNDTTHSTIGTCPNYSEQNLKDYQEFMRNIDDRANRQRIRQQTMCSRPSKQIVFL